MEQEAKTDEEEEEETLEILQAKLLPQKINPLVQKQEGEREEEEEKKETIQARRKNGLDPSLSKDQVFRLRHQSSSGSVLPEFSRRFFENSFGYNFSKVRIHTDSSAENLAHEINAKAFTHGPDVYFGSGYFQPHTIEGRHLLAHELTHVIQQGFAAHHATAPIQRQEMDYEESVFEPTDTEIEEEIEGEEGGQRVEQTGIIQTDDGTNLWSEPDRESSCLGLLPQNTRVFVDRNVGNDWCSIYVEGHQQGKKLPVKSGTHGYVGIRRINLDMPDPGAWLFRITEVGQGALEVAKEVYKDNYKASWGKDYRYLVNVLVTVNEAKGRKFLYKENPKDDWDKAKTIRGGQIWVPGLELVESLHGQVSSGSISYEALSTLADIGVGVAAFIVGLLHGALMSTADIFIGAYDLIKMAGEIIIKLFRGTLITDAKAFFDDISKIRIADVVAMVGEKWNANNVWDKWKFRGYVIGYAIVEIILMVFSVGVVTAVKWAGKVGKVGKLAEYLSKLPKVQKIIDAAKTLSGKGVDKMRAAIQAAHALSEAHGWAARVLRIPLSMLHRLSELDIGKLRKLPQWARERFARLSLEVKLFICGCASPCNVDLRKIEAYLQDLATKGTMGIKKLSSVDDVLDALPEGFKIAKISRKLRKSNSAIMTAIKEAGLTKTDFGKLVSFITPGDFESPAQAYRTFVRYLTGVVPSKTGKGIKKLNEILEKIVKAEPGRGAALKGSMFEQWVALHVPKLASRSFTRQTFDLKTLLNKRFPPFSRTVDKWAEGEIWDMKHHFGKVPADQVADYAALLGKTAPDGNKVKAVHYLFPTENAAKLNKDLSESYGFLVHFIDEATGEMKLLY